ncbi:hypothetical protein, partial [Ralstonia solanacearum]|uniref:hypothetical protein n=1 Tax=Ralstonia solanacearum TaxID=305 RepID=UPI0012D355BD
MKFIVSAAIIATLLAGCASIPQPPGIEASIARPVGQWEAGPIYVSIDPRATSWFDKETSSGIKKIFWDDLKNSEANANLPLERSFVSVVKTDGSVNIGFVSSKFSAEAGRYKTTLDYAKFRDEVMGDSQTPVRVGV